MGIGIAMSMYMHIILETEIYIVRLLLSEKISINILSLLV